MVINSNRRRGREESPVFFLTYRIREVSTCPDILIRTFTVDSGVRLYHFSGEPHNVGLLIGGTIPSPKDNPFSGVLTSSHVTSLWYPRSDSERHFKRTYSIFENTIR